MAYTNLSFFYRQLLTSIIMDQLAENTKFNHLDSGTVCIFFQAAAPSGWTNDAANNDHGIRVVSGSGGGTDGSDGLSATGAHAHTGIAHTHNLAAGSSLQGGPTFGSTGFRSTTSGAGNADVEFLPKYIDVISCTKDA